MIVRANAPSPTSGGRAFSAWLPGASDQAFGRSKVAIAGSPPGGEVGLGAYAPGALPRLSEL